eukprot:6898079-Karenia_brevis.AAC.1
MVPRPPNLDDTALHKSTRHSCHWLSSAAMKEQESSQKLRATSQASMSRHQMIHDAHGTLRRRSST